jgi:hypothetical protein
LLDCLPKQKQVLSSRWKYNNRKEERDNREDFTL